MSMQKLSVLGIPVACMSAVGVAFFVVPPIYKSYFNEPILEEEPFFSLNSRKKVEPEVSWFDKLIEDISITDIIINVLLFAIGICFFLFEKVQGRILEVRAKKLKNCLSISERKLTEFRDQKSHLETTLKMVQNATNEYNLLLFLLLEKDFRSKPNSDHNLGRESDTNISEQLFPLQS